jgi:hypothetical protein
MVRGKVDMAKVEKAPVTRRALVQRLNRSLAGRGQVLRTAVGASTKALGQYYVVERSRVIERNVDLRTLGRRLGVLHTFEALAE